MSNETSTPKRLFDDEHHGVGGAYVVDGDGKRVRVEEPTSFDPEKIKAEREKQEAAAKPAADASTSARGARKSKE